MWKYGKTIKRKDVPEARNARKKRAVTNDTLSVTFDDPAFKIDRMTGKRIYYPSVI